MRYELKAIDYLIGFFAVWGVLFSIPYFIELFQPLPEFGSKDYNPLVNYNRNSGIITITTASILLQVLIVVSILKAYPKGKYSISFLIIFTISSFILGCLTWLELWYGSTFYYGEVRDKQGLGFPLLSIFLIGIPLWKIEWTNQEIKNNIISLGLTIVLGIILANLYLLVKESWNLIQS